MPQKLGETPYRKGSSDEHAAKGSPFERPLGGLGLELELTAQSENPPAGDLVGHQPVGTIPGV